MKRLCCNVELSHAVYDCLVKSPHLYVPLHSLHLFYPPPPPLSCKMLLHIFLLCHATYGVFSADLVHFAAQTWIHRPQGWVVTNNNLSTMLGQKYGHGREGCSMLAEDLKTGEDSVRGERERTATTTFLKVSTQIPTSLSLSITSWLTSYYRTIFHKGTSNSEVNWVCRGFCTPKW